MWPNCKQTDKTVQRSFMLNLLIQDYQDPVNTQFAYIVSDFLKRIIIQLICCVQKYHIPCCLSLTVLLVISPHRFFLVPHRLVRHHHFLIFFLPKNIENIHIHVIIIKNYYVHTLDLIMTQTQVNFEKKYAVIPFTVERYS